MTLWRVFSLLHLKKDQKEDQLLIHRFSLVCGTTSAPVLQRGKVAQSMLVATPWLEV